MLDTPAADLYFEAENLAHRENVKRDTCPTCLSPCQVNVGGDEAGRAVREVPAPRVQGQARSVPSSRHVAHPGALTAAIADPQVRLRFGTLLRFAVAVGLTAWIVWQADLAAIAAAFSRTSWAWVGAACLLVLFDRLLMAYRWIGLLDVLQTRRPPVRSLLRTFFVSTFLGTFLVQTVGSDAIRTWSLARDGVPASESLASVLMDRMLGVVSLLISAAVGVALVPSVLGQSGVVWPFGSRRAGCTLAIALVFSTRLDNAARQWLGRLRPGRVPARGRAVPRRAAGLRLAAWSVGRRAHRSVAVQALRILQAGLLGRGLGLAAPASSYIAFIPLILLVMLLPITFSGLGISQAAFVWAFVRSGCRTRMRSRCRSCSSRSASSATCRAACWWPSAEGRVPWQVPRRTRVEAARLLSSRSPMTESSPVSNRSLSVIIPAYNEAGNILATLENVTTALAPLDLPHEILVIDDGSRDNTAALVRSNLIALSRRPAAVRTSGTWGSAGRIAAASRRPRSRTS